jgi:hypothetical protein
MGHAHEYMAMGRKKGKNIPEASNGVIGLFHQFLIGIDQ